MPREDAFEVEGLVVDVLTNRTYRVQLENGHRLRAFVAGKAGKSLSPFGVGEKVIVEVSPYDLSEGRIIVERQRS